MSRKPDEQIVSLDHLVPIQVIVPLLVVSWIDPQKSVPVNQRQECRKNVPTSKSRVTCMSMPVLVSVDRITATQTPKDALGDETSMSIFHNGQTVTMAGSYRQVLLPSDGQESDPPESEEPMADRVRRMNEERKELKENIK